MYKSSADPLPFLMRIHFIFSGMDVDMVRYRENELIDGMTGRGANREVQAGRMTAFVIRESDGLRRDMMGGSGLYSQRGQGAGYL